MNYVCMLDTAMWRKLLAIVSKEHLIVKTYSACDKQKKQDLCWHVVRAWQTASPLRIIKLRGNTGHRGGHGMCTHPTSSSVLCFVCCFIIFNESVPTSLLYYSSSMHCHATWCRHLVSKPCLDTFMLTGLLIWWPRGSMHIERIERTADVTQWSACHMVFY